MAIHNDVLNIITKKNRVWRFIGLLIGCFICAVVYNTFSVPNNLVTGGIGGLAIVVNKLTGINITTFLNIVTFSLILLCFIIVGFKATSYTLVGYTVYIVMVNLTSSLTSFLTFKSSSFLLTLIAFAVVNGFGGGLIYRMGFNTGGGDSIVVLMQHFFKLPTSKASLIVNSIIILFATSIFGIEKTLYAIVFIKISSFIQEITLLGISDSKMCFIKSNKNSEIESLMKDELKLGYSLIEYTNGVGILKKNMLFCVVPSEMFYDFKQTVMKIDKKAIFISNNCYTVEGGTANYLFPV